MVIVIDEFVDEDLRLSLLEQLPSLKEGATRALLTLKAPLGLERHIHSIVRGGIDSNVLLKQANVPLRRTQDEPMVTLPARIASGSVPMHKDCFNPFDAAEHLPIEDYIGILYLDGMGSLVVETGAGEQKVDVLPGRFVAWHNASSYHRFDAPPSGGVRAMVGPLAIDAEGCTQRAHDVWSTHPGYIGKCESDARRAAAEGDYDEAIRALRNIGIPSLANKLIEEYKEKRKANEQFIVVTLTGKPTREAGEYKLVCTGLSGSSIAEIVVSTDKTFGAVQPSLVKAIKDAKSKSAVPRFLLEGDVLLEASHEEVNIVRLLGGDPTAGEADCSVPGGVAAEVRDRLTPGQQVQVIATGRCGVMVTDDGSDLPYKIKFKDGLLPEADWFKESAVSARSKSGKIQV